MAPAAEGSGARLSDRTGRVAQSGEGDGTPVGQPASDVLRQRRLARVDRGGSVGQLHQVHVGADCNDGVRERASGRRDRPPRRPRRGL
jgi:hypothetical protein